MERLGFDRRLPQNLSRAENPPDKWYGRHLDISNTHGQGASFSQQTLRSGAVEKDRSRLGAGLIAGGNLPAYFVIWPTLMSSDLDYMRLALRLARRGFGHTSPNPMVGAVLVRDGAIIGQGWHRKAGCPHAEIEAFRDAEKRTSSGGNAKGSILYVTLEPCSTHGRTPPCTDAIIAAGIGRIVAATADPNPAHEGKGFALLKRAGIEVSIGLLADKAAAMNEAFNHWIVRRTPLVTVKAAMSLDGRIATMAGESKWITGEKARAFGMRLRAGADAILVGVNTIVADDPSLTIRLPGYADKCWRRIILDPRARTPLTAKVVSDEHAASTMIVVTKAAPASRVAVLSKRTSVLCAPATAAEKAWRARNHVIAGRRWRRDDCVLHQRMPGGPRGFLLRAIGHWRSPGAKGCRWPGR
jgi:diaminohydroxyphosphoribosylaminopyrimidine deaminase / 5-amino-6-(5-phosphoribosylamino)uracil reductase